MVGAMKIEETVTAPAEHGKAPAAPKRYKPLRSPPGWHARVAQSRSSQHATKAIHRNSLANLRPPWPRGTSSNPAGRPKGSRTRQIRKRLLTIDDYRAFYDRRLGVLEADPKTRAHATQIAALDLEAMALQQLPPELRGARALGSKSSGAVHRRCCACSCNSRG